MTWEPAKPACAECLRDPDLPRPRPVRARDPLTSRRTSLSCEPHAGRDSDVHRALPACGSLRDPALPAALRADARTAVGAALAGHRDSRQPPRGDRRLFRPGVRRRYTRIHPRRRSRSRARPARRGIGTRHMQVSSGNSQRRAASYRYVRMTPSVPRRSSSGPTSASLRGGWVLPALQH